MSKPYSTQCFIHSHQNVLVQAEIIRIKIHKLNSFCSHCAMKPDANQGWNGQVFICNHANQKKICINVLCDFANVPSSCQFSCQYYSSSINQQEYGLISSPGVEQFEMHEFLVVKQSFPLRLILSSSHHELSTWWICISLLSYIQISRKTRILLSTNACSGNQRDKLQECRELPNFKTGLEN